MATKNQVRLREDVTAQSAGLVVEADRHVVKGVKLLGLVSSNGRRYCREAVTRALGLYEGVKVNVDHSFSQEEEGQPRRFADRFGRITNVTMRPDGPYGDLSYNPAHPLAATFTWWAANDPGCIGLSHNAVGNEAMTKDGPFVDEIIEVMSVDLVADPATTKGLFECCGDAMDPKKDDKDDDNKVLAEDDPSPDDDLGSDDDLDTDDEGADDETAPADMNDKIADLVRDIVLDSSIDDAAKLAKIKALLKIQSGGEAPVSTEESVRRSDIAFAVAKLRKSADPAVRLLLSEWDTHQARAKVAAKRDTARSLCESARLPAEAVTEIFLDALVACRDARAMQQLIEDRRAVVGVAGAHRPRSASRQGSDVTFQEFVASITGTGVDD